MRIVQLADFARPHAGSFVPMIIGLLNEAKRQGHDCEAVFLEGSRGVEWLADFEAEDIPVTLAPHEAGNRVRLGRWLSHYLGTDSRPTILHTHFTNWDVPACIAAENRNAKVFWHIHSALPHNPLMVARTSVKFATFGRRVSGILCPAPNIVDGARRRLSPRDRTHFIPSSLDLSAFPLLDDAYRASARRELGLDPDAKVLLHFGWHWHLKGSDIFLDTLKLLADADPNVIGIDRGGTEEMV
ncbi:MAG TPA: glycosyltransferase, partial [Solirubrobacterales bacterium]|nr:glycosyltransferase [Solirubrobacterales bacterium]